ncbi:MAG: phenol hydroxylase subunit [Fulvimonas sp.]|nr:phenol hydroxylase subunit [Fulvimonas sp.]
MQASALQPSIHILRRHANGFVEFEFSPGDPDLYLEMVLPAGAFEEFCNRHDAALLDATEQARRLAGRCKWHTAGL